MPKKKTVIAASAIVLIIGLFVLWVFLEPGPDDPGLIGEVMLTTNRYYIMLSSGRCGMDFRLPYPSGTDTDPVIFPSVGEMRDAILNGWLTQKQLSSIRNTFPETFDGNTLICNPLILYDASLPDGVSVDAVTLRGQYYRLDFSGEAVSGWMEYCAKKEKESYAREHIPAGRKDLGVLSSESVQARYATVTYLRDRVTGEEWKFISYSMDSRLGTSITIQEEYLMNKSDTVPECIRFWGDSDGAHFYGYVDGLQERPSIYWVTTFGLNLYQEKKTQ